MSPADNSSGGERVDDSIFRDYYSAWDWLQARWVEVEPTLTSEFAMRVYVITLSAIALTLILSIAYYAKVKLSNLKHESFNIKFPGIDPIHETSIEKRKAAIREKTSKIWSPYRKAMVHLMICGLIIPTAAFLLFCFFYSWFDRAGSPYLDLKTNTTIHMINIGTLWSFMLNQMTHGAFFDFLEVFRIDYGQITNNPNDLWFSGIVLLYRSLVSIFAVALGYAIYETARIYLTLHIKIKAEIKRFKENAKKHALLTT